MYYGYWKETAKEIFRKWVWKHTFCTTWTYSSAGNQSWIFIGRTYPEAKTPILWPPNAKNWLWCWERLKVGGEWNDRGWDGWMASLTQWTWVWVNSGSWWWTRRPGVLQSMRSKESDTTEHLNWTSQNFYHTFIFQKIKINSYEILNQSLWPWNFIKIKGKPFGLLWLWSLLASSLFWSTNWLLPGEEVQKVVVYPKISLSLLKSPCKCLVTFLSTASIADVKIL